ncbi:unnamed protein product [Effrenium voratum]|nr:unnamed protein product [Effrenium voratum]
MLVKTCVVNVATLTSSSSKQACAHGGFSRVALLACCLLDHGCFHARHSAVGGLSDEEAQVIRSRLRLRLGVLSGHKLVSGKSLHDALAALGLTRYTEEDMNELVNLLSDFIGLRFQEETETPSVVGVFRRRASGVGPPSWQWPENATSPSRAGKSSLNLIERVPRSTYNVVPAQALIEVFLAEERDIHKKIFGHKVNQFKAMREILLAGDTNRLVAELTFVRINDLAAPPEPAHPLMYVEPLVALLIVANGIMIGFQTDPAFEDWSGFIYLEVVFASFLILEILLRLQLLKCAPYWCGAERYWNWFDLFLCMTGVTDVAVQLASDSQSDIAGASLLRFCRLIRLVRIVKLFRVKFMKDLRLMVKGLVAGIKTLMLAFALLFAVLYVISGFATITVGQYQRTTEIGLQKYFSNIPASMFTAFRCFTGECMNDVGQPISYLLAAEFGLPFIFCYVSSYMLVSMGIFNLILAVYVDITMRAAKENDAVTAEQYSRESIRVARTTRELLKKFAAAYHQSHDVDNMTSSTFLDALSKRRTDKSTMLFTDDEIQENIAISKELFLLTIQDRTVQSLMDDLDLPPDRANLFEIIDADGSGTLGLPELVQGMLKIRGEISKSDTVAALLVAKAVQSMVSSHMEDSGQQLAALQSATTNLKQQVLRLQSAFLAHFSLQNSMETVVGQQDAELLPSLAPDLPLRPEARLEPVEMEPPNFEAGETTRSVKDAEGRLT